MIVQKGFRILFFSLATLILSVSTPVFAEGPGSVETNIEVDSCSKTGSEERTSLEQYSLYREFYKQDNYADAIKHWRYVYANAPGLRKTTYTNGITIYKYYIDKEEDSLKRELLVDTLMMIYDGRIRCFDERGYVLGRKAYDLYKYRPKEFDVVRNVFKESITLQGNETEYFLIYPYFSYCVIAWKTGNMTAEELLSEFDMLNGIIQYNVENNDKKRADYMAVTEQLEAYLPAEVLSCENLIPRIYETYEEKSSDLNTLKKWYNSIKLQRCTDDPVFLKISKSIFTMEPTSSLAEDIGFIEFNKGNENEAIEYFNKSIELDEDPIEKAGHALNIAKIYKNKGQFSKSRSYAYQALDYTPSWGEPYLLIGDLYASSGKLCGPGTGFESQVVVWVALDKYYKAKAVDSSVSEEANDKINKYTQYMPSKTDLFNRGISEGSTYTVGCWINETTTVRGVKSGN